MRFALSVSRIGLVFVYAAPNSCEPMALYFYALPSPHIRQRLQFDHLSHDADEYTGETHILARWVVNHRAS
jgi:hypothetical protein